MKKNDNTTFLYDNIRFWLYSILRWTRIILVWNIIQKFNDKIIISIVLEIR